MNEAALVLVCMCRFAVHTGVCTPHITKSRIAGLHRAWVKKVGNEKGADAMARMKG